MRGTNQKGFSLIEIMIAITIGLSMVTVLAVSISKQQYKAKMKKAKIEMKALENAIIQYEAEKSGIPSMDQGLKALVEEGYIDKKGEPKDPWGTPYAYVVPGPDNQPYDIMSYGADKAEGGDGNGKDLKLSEIEAESEGEGK